VAHNIASPATTTASDQVRALVDVDGGGGSVITTPSPYATGRAFAR